MRPHHQHAVDLLSAHFQADPDCIALVIGGSVAHGLEREDSDVDFMLVMTDEAYARAAADRRYHHYRQGRWEPRCMSDGANERRAHHEGQVAHSRNTRDATRR